MDKFWALVNKYLTDWEQELVSGLMLATGTVLVLFLPKFIAVGVLATAGSLIYESKFDANGWNWKDVGKREVGIVLTTLAFYLVSLL